MAAMSVKEGLVSEDEEVIKKARGTAKGTVTIYLNRLPMVLIKDDDRFLHEQIDRSEVKEIFDKLDENLQNFQILHERYFEFREVLSDSQKE